MPSHLCCSKLHPLSDPATRDNLFIQSDRSHARRLVPVSLGPNSTTAVGTSISVLDEEIEKKLVAHRLDSFRKVLDASAE